MRDIAKHLSVGIVAASATMLATSPMARADLILNGNFEADGNVGYTGITLGPITGWSVSGQRVVVNTEGNTDPDPTATGHGLVFDDATSGSTPASNTHSGVAWQDISTTPGSTYALTFDYGSLSAPLQKINAQVIGSSTLATQTINKNFGIFSSHTISFTANSATTRIQFSDATAAGSEDGLNDGIIDNVHVNTNNTSLVSLNNASFENYNADPNSFNGTRTPNTNPAARYAGWIVEGNAGLLIDDTNNARIQSGKDGTQFVQINSASATISQSLSTLVQSYTDYTFTVAIGVATGDFNAGFISHGASLQLIAQNANGVQTVLGTTSLTGTTINGVGGANTGNLLDYSLSIPYTAGILSAHYGEQLVLRINSLNTGGISENIFDNVRFTATAVPEPAALSAIALGGLLGLRRRR